MDKLASQVLFGRTKNKMDKFADDTARDLKVRKRSCQSDAKDWGSSRFFLS